MAAPVSLRKVALPVEHGAWAFWLEPALLGLLLAPSSAGVLLVVAALAALLLQTPLSLALADARRGRRYPRTVVAWRVAAVYGAVLGVSGTLALVAAGSLVLLLPALLATPLVALQLTYDARHQGRALVPELAGAVAMGSLAACVALAGGWGFGSALVLWGLLAARAIPSIVYVRTRLRLERGQAVGPAATWASHVVALALVSGGALIGWVPALALVGFGVLAVRAVLGVSSRRVSVPARVIGFRELAFGLLVVTLVASGFALAT